MTTAAPSTRSDAHLAVTFADQGFVHVPSVLSTQEASEGTGVGGSSRIGARWGSSRRSAVYAVWV
ncbi:MAG TPA: hypothetical protein VF892_11615 [Pseudonocardiaceae bacterium]